MDKIKQKQKNTQFIDYWKNAEGSEDRECQQFWTDFCRDVLDIQNTSKVLDFEKKVRGKKIDVFLENEGILIEQKSRGINLDQPIKHGNEYLTAYEQAKRYMSLLPRSLKPYWIITCNFDYIRIYNMDDENPSTTMVEIRLDELDKNLYLFDIFTKKEHTKLYKEEQLSFQAGEIVGDLYNKISKLYNNLEDSKKEQKSLNILITRLVFLLYAEDSDLLHESHAFLKYMKHIPAGRFHVALRDLFETLDTPVDKRSEYLEDALKAFPYINGGLFHDKEIIIPPFDENIKTELLLNASQQFNWSDISPTIFGAVFESTLNPKTRRSGGMHYTSIENIHKVIDPLFLDDLKSELSEIEGERVKKTRNFKLIQFQNKLASLKILDPAAGSHNFLTETFICLRKLEIRVLENLHDNEYSIIEDPIKVNIGQMYAIEINDFAVTVGKTALWIAEQQMLEQTQEVLLNHEFHFFPIKNVSNSICANALRINWNNVLPAQECSYIIGNPPFYGARNQSKEQKQEIIDAFDGAKNSGNIDYVAGWYITACKYMKDYPIRCAYVSTNSICQGEQVANVWKPIFDLGFKIDFAYDTFRWKNDAKDTAHVFCVIIGFSKQEVKQKYLFHHDNPNDKASLKNVDNINGYLKNAPIVYIWNSNKPINNIPLMGIGSQPIDNGNYLFSELDYKKFIEQEPNSKKFFHKWLGSNEFINNINRYVLWLGNASTSQILSMPYCKERVDNVKKYRSLSKRSQTLKASETPNHFGTEIIPNSNSILMPRVSSEKRLYIPIGFIKPKVFCSDSALLIPNAKLYHFGILTSQFHNAWTRTVCGRLESRYRYSAGIVYNNFPWPGVTKENIDMPVEDAIPSEIKENIENCAQTILDTRNKYPDNSLAELYDPDKMPKDLKDAHLSLDIAVEKAYDVSFNGHEEKIVAHLFKLYNEITKDN